MARSRRPADPNTDDGSSVANQATHQARHASHIRVATSKDLAFIKHLAARNSNAVGFIPDAGVLNYVDAGCVTITRENDDEAGYLLARPREAGRAYIRPIVQAAVCFDARRRRHALSLVDDLARAAFVSGQLLLQCWCREELEANDFWQAAGFIAVARRHAGSARGKPCILWRRPLSTAATAVLATISPTHRVFGPGGRWLDSTTAVLPTTELLELSPLTAVALHDDGRHTPPAAAVVNPQATFTADRRSRRRRATADALLLATAA